MTLGFLGAAMAALSAATATPERGDDEAILVQEAPASAGASRVLLAIAAAAAAIAVSENSDETLEIYPFHFAPWRETARAAGGPQFEVGGVGFSFTAFRPKGPSDPLGLSNFRSESRAMGKFMPGYPQPARVVVGLKVSF